MKEINPGSKTRGLSVQVDMDMYETIRKICYEERTTQRTIFRKALKHFLDIHYGRVPEKECNTKCAHDL